MGVAGHGAAIGVAPQVGDDGGVVLAFHQAGRTGGLCRDHVATGRHQVAQLAQQRQRQAAGGSRQHQQPVAGAARQFEAAVVDGHPFQQHFEVDVVVAVTFRDRRPVRFRPGCAAAQRHVQRLRRYLTQPALQWSTLRQLARSTTLHDS